MEEKKSNKKVKITFLVFGIIFLVAGLVCAGICIITGIIDSNAGRLVNPTPTPFLWIPLIFFGISGIAGPSSMSKASKLKDIYDSAAKQFNVENPNYNTEKNQLTEEKSTKKSSDKCPSCGANKKDENGNCQYCGTKY